MTRSQVRGSDMADVIQQLQGAEGSAVVLLLQSTTTHIQVVSPFLLKGPRRGVLLTSEVPLCLGLPGPQNGVALAGRAGGGGFGAKREQLTLFSGLLPESQGHNLALTVVYVPCLLDLILLLLPSTTTQLLQHEVVSSSPRTN